MADTEAPAAPSSTAAPTETPAAPEQYSIPADAKARAEWRQTGKLPGADDKDTPPNKEDSASSKSADEKSSGKAAPVSETGERKQERTNEKTRVEQLLAERQQYRSELDALRVKLEALEAGKSDAKPADSSPAPDKHAKAASSPAPELKRPTRPNSADFDNWDEVDKANAKYEQDMEQYHEDRTRRIVMDALEKRDQHQHMVDRLQEAESRYGESGVKSILGTARSITEDQEVPLAIKTAISRSGVVVDALYVIGSDEKSFREFVQLAKSDPLEAIRQWYDVERMVREELGKAQKNGTATPARGPNGQFLAEKQVPAKPRTAPPPPHELNGNAAPPGDERERAANSGDFRSFKQEGDRRDALRWKG